MQIKALFMVTSSLKYHNGSLSKPISFLKVHFLTVLKSLFVTIHRIFVISELFSGEASLVNSMRNFCAADPGSILQGVG